MNDDSIVDATLISQCIKGDQDSWRQLVNRYQALVYSVIRLHFRESGTAEDIFQEVWLETFNQLDKIRNIQALPAWLMTVTRRKCYRAVGSVEWDDVDSDSIGRIDQGLSAIENRFWLELMLKNLNEREKRIIHALYLSEDQPTYQELSDQLGIPVASIGPTRARALTKLRSQSVEQSVERE